MRRNESWRPALAAMAATAGAGYASGREVALFFGQTGRAAWAGIAFAAVVFGLMTGMIARCARQSDARSLAGLCRRQLGRRFGAVAGGAHALLMAMTAVVMLESAGEMGALALPLRHGYLWGAGFALMAALLAAAGGLRALSALGGVTAGLSLLFYTALALDARPVRLYARVETALRLRDSLGAAILLGGLYAAMNACLAGGVLMKSARGEGDPSAIGLRAGGALGALLCAANAALLRGGEVLMAQAVPTVILAARWGRAGFWLSALLGWLCAAGTLAAALSALSAQMNDGVGECRIAKAMLALTAAICAALGLTRRMGAAYGALGWLCAAMIGAIALRFDRKRVP